MTADSYVCSNELMERRKFWWNGKWGRVARRDILLYEDGGRWWVERRDGGVEGRSTWSQFASEQAAHDAVRSLTAGAERWREM
jgi:hypothetical protein